MLTVIAIVSVLAGLLLPTVNKAKAKSHAITCMANMRQLGIALTMYSGDYRNVLPRSGDSESAGLEGCWFYAIDPYLLNIPAKPQTPAQKLTPIKQDPIWKTFDHSTRLVTRTIKMNRKLIGTKTGQWDVDDKLDATPAPDPSYRNKLTIDDMANTVLLFDGRCEETISDADRARYDGYETYVARRHTGGANVLFVDGHSEWRIEKQQTTGKKYGWDKDNTRLTWWATN